MYHDYVISGNIVYYCDWRGVVTMRYINISLILNYNMKLTTEKFRLLKALKLCLQNLLKM